MNAALQMTHCPGDETLAAFIDGRSGPEERQSVIEHMAGCADCRDVLLVSGELAEESEEKALAPVVPMRRKRWLVPAVAAAAVVSVVFLSPVGDQLLQKYRLHQLASAVEALDERPLEGRTSLSIAHRPHSTRRGPADAENPQYGLLAAALSLAKVAQEKETVSTLHAAGVAFLMLENTEDENRKELGVALLERALKAQTGQVEIDKAIEASTDAELLNDLAAGYHATVGDRAREQRTIKAIEQAWQLRKSETVAWTRAVVLRSDDAWRDYLSIDATSPWSAEARSHLESSIPK